MNYESWEYWLSTYGVWAVLLGTFLEGESILVAGAIAARQGYMSITSVLVAALAGSFVGDQLYFFLGRIYGRKFLLNRPKWQHRVARVHRLLDTYHAAFILGFRFLYGLRSIAPFVPGTSSVPARRFVPLNFIGALVWSLTVGGMGYAIGKISLTALITGEDGDRPWWVVAGIVSCIVATAMLIIRRIQRSAAATEPEAPADAPQGELPSGQPDETLGAPKAPASHEPNFKNPPQ